MTINTNQPTKGHPQTKEEPLKFHELNRGKGDNRYCGPAVVSFITGINTSDAATLMRQAYGARAIRGSDEYDVKAALRKRGYRLANIAKYTIKGTRYSQPAPTLARWLKDSKEERVPGRMFLLAAGNHWQLIMGRKYACGRIGDIVSVRDKRIKRRARVTEVYEVIKTENARQAPRKKGKLL